MERKETVLACLQNTCQDVLLSVCKRRHVAFNLERGTFNSLQSCCLDERVRDSPVANPQEDVEFVTDAIYYCCGESVPGHSAEESSIYCLIDYVPGNAVNAFDNKYGY